MDGIKPSLSDLNDDQTPVYDPVKVDLLHPSEAPNLEPSVPAASPRVAPITPPYHGAPESNVEMVQNTPPPEPVVPAPAPARVPDAIAPAAPIHDDAPKPVASTTDAAVMTGGPAPMTAPSRGKRGPIVVLIVLLLLIAAGGGAYYYYFVLQKKPTVSAPAAVALTTVAPTKLTQEDAKGALANGATTNTPPTLGATLETQATSGSAILQVEVEPLTTAFTGTPTASGQAVSANGANLLLSVALKSLKDGSYHWQARTEVGSSTSSWVVAPGSTLTTPNFVIASTAPAAPTVSAVGGGTVTGTTLTTTQNEPALSGTTTAGSSLSILVTPDNITLTPTVAANGSWTVTPTQQLANGAHTLALTTTDAAGNHSQASYTLTVNPVVTAAPATSTPVASSSTTPSASSSNSVAATTPSTTTPVNTTKLAATGDPTQPITLIALVLGLGSIVALVYLRRYDRG